MIEKEEMIVGGIDMGQGLISPIPINAGTIRIHESHVDTGIVPIPESHVDVGTVPILESRIDTGTVHVHVRMPTEVQTPRGAMASRCHYGCYESCLTQSLLVAVLRQH